ncbi:hypothetical protein POPA111323_09655 [Polynucleobacter paneuropaeus]|uniref:Glycosyltransferase 2-like domain-containing protein n=1 Tax=Polynucleobacter paneuropaeus TaxID=2527775 RepID=A0A2Z4JR33_9BURK|nr:hypothetical protein [Polynucleobacter paneuropaeus]AWW49196.1 hypothetical protein Pas1_01680 [Polynucleobacter paneuropaeus]
MELSSLAPVLVATHTRIDHLMQTISALRRNELASKTHLFIASDAARSESEQQKVLRIREYINSIDGFWAVTKIFREKNFGHFQNFQDATNMVFRDYDQIIKLEDDIVTAPGFLNFMNQGLLRYKNDKRLISISGHLWEGVTSSGDTMLLPAANGWGWAIWRDRFYLNDHSPSLAKEFLNNPYLFLKMCLTNPSLLGMVNAIANKKLIAGDVSWALYIIKNDKLVLFPGESLVRNIGFDGSGQNCTADEKFHQQSISIKTNFTFDDHSEGDIRDSSKKLFLHYGGYPHMIYQIFLYSVEKLFGKRGFESLRKLKNFVF